MPEDEKTLDQEQWFESEMASIKEFMKATKTWIADVHEGSLQKDDAEVDPQDAVKSSDSISQYGASCWRRPSERISRKSQNYHITSFVDTCEIRG